MMQGNGISFFDVTANVTLESVVVMDTARDGITLTPTFHRDQLIPSDVMYPTFRLCDANTNLFVKRGEEYKFFATGATDWTSCIRRFVTEERYSIKVTMKAATGSYYGVLTAEFYDGAAVDINSRISSFKAYTKDRGSQVSSRVNHIHCCIYLNVFVRFFCDS